jgi:hypothetical protein
MNISTIRRFVAFAVLLLPLGLLLTGCPDKKPADNGGGTIGTYNTPYANALNAINHNIQVGQGLYLAHNFARNRDSLLKGYFSKRDTLIIPVCETFKAADVLKLLQQDSCAGLRIYLGMRADKQIVFVLVGAHAKGHDLLPKNLIRRGEMWMNEKTPVMKQAGGGAAEPALLLEDGQRCPPNNLADPALPNPGS